MKLYPDLTDSATDCNRTDRFLPTYHATNRHRVLASSTFPYFKVMELSTFDFLRTPSGEAALAVAMALSPTEARFLQCFDKLRKRYTVEIAKAALETAILRQKAAVKFQNAARMFFTKEALEQSSSEIVARHRAARFRGMKHVADLCCGIGGDALALAKVATTLSAFELDPLRSRMAEANLIANGATNATVIVADVMADHLGEFDAVFCDPSRRSTGRRYLAVGDYQPNPLEVAKRFAGVPLLAFKLAPGIPRSELEAFDAEMEFVSLNGELKECVAWLRDGKTCLRRATVLPSGETFTAIHLSERPMSGPPLRYLYDPDPTVIRAELEANLCEKVSGQMLDERIALITSDVAVDTPFATRYEIVEVLPFHIRKLNDWLREHQVGRITLLNRGSRLEPDEVTRKLKLTGSEHRQIILTQIAEESFVIVAK